LRKAELKRITKETSIRVSIDLDGKGKNNLNTGIGFFDHLLDQFSFYSGVDINGEIEGDLHIDCHHTIEDLGYVIGECIRKALDMDPGIERFSSQYIAMDEPLVRSAIDLSGRPFLYFDYYFERERIGQLETECIKEFFRALVTTSKMTLHLDVIRGENNHHIAEALFKALGRSFAKAKVIISDQVTSTKGVI
jgi:imidazoleglycerol-phosphate dehydratase